MALQAGVCCQCQSPYHILRNCPLRQHVNPGRTPPSFQHSTSINTSQPIHHYTVVFNLSTQSWLQLAWSEPTQRFNNLHATLDHQQPPTKTVSMAHLAEDTQAQIVELSDMSNDLENLSFGQANIEMGEGAPIVDYGESHHLCATITTQSPAVYTILTVERLNIKKKFLCST
ncbi:hypothetical protein MJO28_016927 [Puccinia striiformis f. sp. tritici]|nr:hypothetical protein MJO28_016927 [Puccinia striiformis f. sp. tritici]